MLLHYSNYFFRSEAEDRKILRKLCEAFQNNKRMKALLKHRSFTFQHGLNALIAYCYFMVKKLNGIFISSNRATYLLYYKKSRLYSNLLDHLHYLYLALFVIGIRYLPREYRREKFIRKVRQEAIQRHGDHDYWYVWFLAQDKNEKSIKGLIEVKHHIEDLIHESKLPMYMETTEEKLLPMYQRVGFQFYAYEEQSAGMKIWFGRMVPQ